MVTETLIDNPETSILLGHGLQQPLSYESFPASQAMNRSSYLNQQPVRFLTVESLSSRAWKSIVHASSRAFRDFLAASLER